MNSDNQPVVDKSMTLEEALRQLEAVVAVLEKGDIALDDAVAAYEKGARLKTLCQKLLDEARLKVDTIRASGDGDGDGVTTTPFDPSQSGNP